MPLPPVGATEWPDSSPKHDEDKVISIVCGNSHLHWAFHEGWDNKFAPTLFWRTPHLTDKETEDGACEALSRHLPETAHEFIFGEGDPSSENAQKTAAKRREREISVYIVSSNDEQARNVKYIWKDIPSRVFMMQGNDFFTAEEGRYDSMGVDRLAVLYAAGTLSGFPALVFDGGTALTYSAASADGKIMGGGITLGLGAKLQSLADHTGALPFIEPNEINQRADRAEKGETLNTFATDTRTAITVSAFNEIAYSARTIIRHWLDNVGPPRLDEAKASGDDATEATGEETAKISDADKSGGANIEEMKTDGLKIVAGKKTDEAANGPLTNKNRRVIVTGGDADVLRKLLEPDHSGIVAPDPSTPVQPAGYEVQKIKHMIHYGIAGVLEKKTAQRPRDPELDSWKKTFMGTRIAKRFDIADADADFVFRGSISSVLSGEDREDRSQDLFQIVYDDGDGEQFDVNDLYEALLLYSEQGEKSDKDIDAALAQERKDASTAAAKLVASTLQKIREEKTKKAAEAAAAQAKPAPAPAAGKPVSKKKKSPPKPKETEPPRPAKKAKRLKKDPKSYKNQRVAKYFGTEVFFGTVDDCVSGSDDEPPLWHVAYDDGDDEDYDEKELRKALKLFKKEKDNDPKSSQAADGDGAESNKEKPTSVTPQAPDHGLVDSSDEIGHD